MDYLKVFLLAYLLAVIPITGNDVLLKVRRIINGGKGQHSGKGCTRLQGSAKCSLHVRKQETRVIDSNNSVLPDNSECFTYNGCFTCRDGSWATSACKKELLHRQKRLSTAAVFSIIDIIGAAMSVYNFVCRIFCKGDDVKDYKPPKFTSCKGPESPINIPHGKRSATVKWQKPTYEAGSLGMPKLMLASTTGDSGNTFLIGYYTITYQLVDSQAHKVSCSFSFRVKVQTCSWPGWPDNGQIRCSSDVLIYGDTCKIFCNQGYFLSGESQVMCEANGRYNFNMPKCLKKQCPILTRPDHSNGFTCTDGNNYNSVCSLNCDTASGFTSSPRLTICRSTQTWQLPYPECSDTLHPEFTNCPSEAIPYYLDRGKTTAVVRWVPITATDNSGTVKVKQVVGLRPGQTFSEGSTMIQYTATDPSGHTAYCSFAVKVIALSCKPPNFNDENMKIKCAQGYKFGSQCTVSCQMGYRLKGRKIITCEKDGSVIPRTHWDHGRGNPPSCKKQTCKKLTAPKHGMLSCDYNITTAFCIASCDEQWGLPRTAVSVNMYTCGMSTGKWRPLSNVPDCTKEHIAKHLEMKLELYYYSRDCSDTKKLEKIRKRFQEILDDKKIWDDGCSCTAKKAFIRCTKMRKKRDVKAQKHDIKKRSVSVAIITWYWFVPIDLDEPDKQMAKMNSESYLMMRANKLQKLIDRNSLNIGMDGFEFRKDSFRIYQAHLICPKGYLGIFRLGTCSPCPTGSMYSETTHRCAMCQRGTYQDEEGQFQCKSCPSGKITINEGSRSQDKCVAPCPTGSMYSEATDKCAMCQPGTYQDEEGQFQCKACPLGTTTITEGSRSQDKCLELCPAGHFSTSSVVPCDECPVGKYQTVTGSTACMSCQQGFTTSSTASTSCQPMDKCKQKSPCNGHPCVNLPGSYRCKCQDGFSGLDCSKPPDYCLNNECKNGICKSTSSNYTCKCFDGFKGRFCDEHIVNGGWSDWANWDQCSLTCGEGTVTRRRRCDNPQPTRPEGQNCTGSATETGLCNTEDCPVCDASNVRRGIGSTVRCNGTSSALDCIAICRKQDYVIDVTGRLRVSCRNGVWDFKRPKVASCTKAVSPSRLTIETNGTLNTRTCLSEDALRYIESSISHKANNLQCGTDASCQTVVRVQDEGCKASGRKKRSAGTVVTITQTFSIPDGNLRLGDFMASKEVSPQLQKLIEAVKVLEASAEQLQNDSSIFDVTVDGSQFSVLQDSFKVTPGVLCPAGTVERDMMCVYCSPGTYNKDGRCKYCDFGTYQDESGKTVCKPCPAGKSTEFTGSTALEECAAYCLPGTYNKDGRCEDCHIDTYQDEANKTVCKPCPTGKSTKFTGSTALEKCTASGLSGLVVEKEGNTPKHIGPIIGVVIAVVILLGLCMFAVFWECFRTEE